MTKPNRHIKNQIVLLSRRTLNNEALILPSEKGDLMREITYIIVFNAKQFGLEILSLQVNPRGYEIVVFDPRAQRSAFLKATNQLISLRVKKRIQHDESLWTTKKPGNQPILDLPSLKKEIVKCCTHAVRNKFVRHQRDWEMPQIGPADWGEERSFKNAKGNEIVFLFGPGHLVTGLTDTQILKEQLIEEIDQTENEQSLSKENVLGMEGCYSKKSFEGWTFKIEKKVLTFISEFADRLNRATERMRAFCTEHRLALADYIDGKGYLDGSGPTQIKFPVGTLKMCTQFNQIWGPPDQDDPHAFRI